MRTLTAHVVNPCNDKLKITVVDEPGSGGANHRYDVSGFNAMHNPSMQVTDNDIASCNYAAVSILFQNGPINEVGVNGITHEALLAILEDRLVGFQNGKFANDYNARALEHVRAAQAALRERTRERMARDVEGTHKI